jgi:hypothetical protein
VKIYLVLKDAGIFSVITWNLLSLKSSLQLPAMKVVDIGWRAFVSTVVHSQNYGGKNEHAWTFVMFVFVSRLIPVHDLGKGSAKGFVELSKSLVPFYGHPVRTMFSTPHGVVNRPPQGSVHHPRIHCPEFFYV